MLIDKSLKEFFKDREDYLKRPSLCHLGGSDLDVRNYYSIDSSDCIIYDDKYYFKDKNNNEYHFISAEKLSEKEMWEMFDKLVLNNHINCNVRDILIQKQKEREEAKKRRKAVLKHVTPFFLEDKPSLVKKAPIELVLYEFVSYWYGYTGCRGIINRNKTTEYINLFLTKVNNDANISDIRDILEKFEKQIREDNGVVEISS